MVLGEFLGVWAWGLFFCGMNGGTNGQSASGLLRRTGSRPCSRLAGSLSVLVFGGVREWWFAGRWWAINAALDVGGVSFFGGGVVRGLGIEAVLDRVWCFCVIFKFIFGVFWIIIMEKDGWPDWLRLTD